MPTANRQTKPKKTSGKNTARICRIRNRIPFINNNAARPNQGHLKGLTVAPTFPCKRNFFMHKTQPGTPRHRRTRVPLLSSDPGGVHPFALHGTRLQAHAVFKNAGCQTETPVGSRGIVPKTVLSLGFGAEKQTRRFAVYADVFRVSR